MAGKTLKTSILIGGAVSGSLRGALSTTENGLQKIGAAIANVDKRQRLLGRSIEVFGKAGKNVDRLRAQYGELSRGADRLRVAQERLAKAQERIDANNARRRQLGGEFRGALGGLGAVIAAVALPVRDAVAFESAMLGVAKQVEGARDAGGKLTPVYHAMSREVQRLGREIPIATNEIADMVAAGARMGVARDQLIGFTRTSAMMADAFDLPAGKLADDMGKIAGLFQIPVPKIGGLGDAINFLDDNAKSAGGDIINVLQRIGGMAQTLKMPAKEAAALGSTFLTLGSTAEVAGTASNAVMRILGAATAQSKRVRKGFESIGFDPAVIQASMSKDPTGTILKLLDALNALNDEQRIVAATRIFGAEYGDDMAKLAVGADEYRRQLSLVNSEQSKGSMQREFNSRLGTTAAQWQIAKNRATELSGAIGGALLPSINRLMGSIGPLVDSFSGFARENPRVVSGIVGTAFALTGLRVATKGAQLAWVTLKTPVLAVMGRVAAFRATGAVASLGKLAPAGLRVFSVLRTVGTAITAIGAVGAGPIAIVVGALVGGALLVRKYWEPIKLFFAGMWTGIKETAGPAIASLAGAFAPLQPVFHQFGKAIGVVWRWFGELLTPMTAAEAKLTGATSAGVAFGQGVGRSIATVVNVIGGVVRAMVWLSDVSGKVGAEIGNSYRTAWDVVKNVVGSAVDWIVQRMQPMLTAVRLVRSGIGAAANAVGLGSAAAPPAARVSGARRPATSVAPRTVGNTQRPRTSEGRASRPVAIGPNVKTPKPAATVVRIPAAQSASAPKIGGAVVNIASAKPVAAPVARIPSAKPQVGPSVRIAAAKPGATVVNIASAKPAATPKPGATVVRVAAATPAAKAPAAKTPPPLQTKPASNRTASAAPAKAAPTFNIYQQPGESSDALADRVIAKMDARDRTQRRGRLEDEAA